MLNFNSEWKKIEFEVEGEKISGEVKPLTVDQMIELAPVIAPGQDGPGIMFKQQKAFQPFIEECVRNIEGISINGKEIEVKQLATEASLVWICIALLKHALLAGNIDKESEKNLQLPSEEK